MNQDVTYLKDILNDYKSTPQWILTVISFSILLHEYVLTFQYEVERFWPKRLKDFFRIPDVYDDALCGSRTSGRGIKWSSFLFFSNRYIALFGHFPVMVQFFWRTRTGNARDAQYIRCDSLQMYHQALAFILQVIIGSILILRMYALYERKKRVLMVYIGLTVPTVGLFIWGALWKQGDETPFKVHLPYGCTSTVSEYRAHLFLAPWTSELIFDICVFAMTLWKTLTLPRGKGLGVLTMIMRDGTLYFAAMATLIIGNILTLILGGPLSRGSVTILVNAVSSTLVSRLLINLRDPKWQMDGRYYDSSTINGIGFRAQDGLTSTFAA